MSSTFRTIEALRDEKYISNAASLTAQAAKPPEAVMATKPQNTMDSVLSESQKLAYMLGKDSIENNVSLRENFCASCGQEHPNPALMDMYGNCINCFSVLREPYHLRQRYEKIPIVDKLEILYATFGDPVQPLQAIEVTQQIRERVKYYTNHDRLAFKLDSKIDEVLGIEDPAPDKSKQLRVRYRMKGALENEMVFGNVVLDTLPDNHFPSPIMLLVPKAERYLRIFRAIYGHPKGASSTGAMSQDVTEIIQGFADLQGSSYLYLSSLTPLHNIFGDPCPGYTKDLRIEYEVSGRHGTIIRDEFRGHLKKRIFLEEAPTVAPLIMVQSATYGITPTGRREQLRVLEKLVGQVRLLEHKQDQGVLLTDEELDFIRRRKQPLEAELENLRTAPVAFFDVTSKLQKMADRDGLSLHLDKDKFDANTMFGNPVKGRNKLLEINLVCHGHDSERYADSKELTTSGHPRNFIVNKNGRYLLSVLEDSACRGRLTESMHFQTNYAAPVIHIARATYGNFSDSSMLLDCTTEVQRKVDTKVLRIDTEEDLHAVLGSDPCPGLRKQLRIEYVTRGFCGNLRVREKDGHLAASIQLGYVPKPPEDE